MERTITTHNGSDVSHEHNIRAPYVVAKEEHIDPSLSYRDEILVDIPLKQAYAELFDAARIEYNNEMVKKGHSERQIDNYLAKIRKDKKKHPVYEMIIQIGNRDDTGVYGELELACLKEFIAGWGKRNPNLKLIGAYIHADEINGTLHAHLDYIPVAYNCSRGMKTQTALVQALGAQGFVGVSTKQTAQIAWEKRENETLEQICVNHGIEVVHPKTGEKHRDKPQFIEYQKTLDKIKDEIGDKQKQVERLESKADYAEKLIKHREELLEHVENTIDNLDNQYQEKNIAVEHLNAELEKKNAALTETSAALADNKALLDKSAKKVSKIKDINEIQTGKTLLGKTTIDDNDLNELRGLAKKQIAAESKENELQKQITALKDDKKKLFLEKEALIEEKGRVEQEYRGLKKENNELRSVYGKTAVLKLQAEFDKLQQVYNKVLEFIEQLNLKEKLEAFLNPPNLNKTHKRGHNRML